MDMKKEVKALLREVFGLQGIKTSLKEVFSGWVDYLLAIAPFVIFFGSFLAVILAACLVVFWMGRSEIAFIWGLVGLPVWLYFLADRWSAFKKNCWNKLQRKLFEAKMTEAVKKGFRL